MTAYWPIYLPQCLLYEGASGGPQDVRASFEPDVGEAISRPRMTAAIELYKVSPPVFEVGQLSDFATWFQDETARGSKVFVWRHPVLGHPVPVKFAPGETYSVSKRGKWRTVTFNAVILPGSIWYSDYIPSGYSIVPAMIADFANDTYATDTATMAKALRDDLFALTGDPVDDATGLTLDADDTAEVSYGAWMPTEGTLVVELLGATESGTGVAVVSFDADEALVYTGGTLVDTLSRDLMPYLTFEDAETVVSLVIYPARLPAAKCKAMATGGLVLS